MTRNTLKAFKVLLAVTALAAATGFAGPAQSQEPKPIVIAVINPFTGPVAQMGQHTLNGIELFMKERGNTIKGRPIKFIQLDTQCTPSKAVDAANRVLDQAIAVIGPNCSGDMAAIQLTLQKAKIPHFCPCFLPTLSTRNDDYFFRTAPSDTAMMQVLVNYIQKQGIKKIALAHDTTGFGVGEGDAIVAALKKNGMPAPVVLLPFETSTTDFSGQIGRVKSSDAEAFVIASYDYIQGLVVKQARELGLTIPIYAGAPASQDPFRRVGGPAVNGVIYSSSFSVDDPVTLNYVKAYRDAYGHFPDPNVLGAHIAIAALYDVLEKNPDLKGEELRDALRKVDLKTPAGQASWGPSGDQREGFGILGTVKDGKAEIMERVKLD